MENQSQPDNREIDLAMVSGRIKGYFTRVNDSIFDWILFFKRNLVWLIAVIVLGVALGWWLDKGDKPYEQRIVAIPNFESVDYLYEKVGLINEKIKEGDEDFFKSIGISKAKKLQEIKVEPIIEIYDFIKKEEGTDKSLQVFKLMAENDNMDNILEGMPTARNYKKHLIVITTAGPKNEAEVVQPFLDYLNGDAYFKQIQQSYVENLRKKIVFNDSIINQIDNVIGEFGANRNNDSKMLVYSDNTQISNILYTKMALINEKRENSIKLVDYTDIIKPSSLTLNVRKSSITAGHMKFILPILFIMLFIFVAMFRAFYTHQVNKRKILVTNA